MGHNFLALIDMWVATFRQVNWYMNLSSWEFLDGFYRKVIRTWPSTQVVNNTGSTAV